MALQTITYSDKSTMNSNSDVPAVNKVQATDMNEIKSVVNNNANILGDYVSAVGSNYIKYESGIMICWDTYSGTVNITSSAGGMYYATCSFVFPQEFIAAPVVIPSLTQSSGILWAGRGNSSTQTTTGTQLRIISGVSSSNASITANYVAIGKWK